MFFPFTFLLSIRGRVAVLVLEQVLPALDIGLDRARAAREGEDDQLGGVIVSLDRLDLRARRGASGMSAGSTSRTAGASKLQALGVDRLLGIIGGDREQTSVTDAMAKAPCQTADRLVVSSFSDSFDDSMRRAETCDRLPAGLRYDSCWLLLVFRCSHEPTRPPVSDPTLRTHPGRSNAREPIANRRLSCILSCWSGAAGPRSEEGARRRQGLPALGRPAPAPRLPRSGIVPGRRPGEHRRFEVTIGEDAAILETPAMRKYDLIIVNADRRDPEFKFTEGQQKAIFEFVRSGHGYVSIHGADNAAKDWLPAWKEMLGGVFSHVGTARRQDQEGHLHGQDRRHAAARSPRA